MMTCLFYGEGVCANNTMGKRRRFGRWLVAQYDHAVYIGPDSVHNSRPPSYRIISSQGGSQSWSKDRVRISSFKSSALTIKGGSHVRGASEDGSNGRGLDSEHDSGDTCQGEHRVGSGFFSDRRHHPSGIGTYPIHWWFYCGRPLASEGWYRRPGLQIPR